MVMRTAYCPKHKYIEPYEILESSPVKRGTRSLTERKLWETMAIAAPVNAITAYVLLECGHKLHIVSVG